MGKSPLFRVGCLGVRITLPTRAGLHLQCHRSTLRHDRCAVLSMQRAGVPHGRLAYPESMGRRGSSQLSARHYYRWCRPDITRNDIHYLSRRAGGCEWVSSRVRVTVGSDGQQSSNHSVAALHGWQLELPEFTAIGGGLGVAGARVSTAAGTKWRMVFWARATNRLIL